MVGVKYYVVFIGETETNDSSAKMARQLWQERGRRYLEDRGQKSSRRKTVANKHCSKQTRIIVAAMSRMNNG